MNKFTKTGLLLLIVFVTQSANAKIWRLNNNGNNQIPAITADFPATTTLQQAHDNGSVVSGDTIHVEQSPVTYGPCIFTKRLVVIGAGYHLGANPNTQVNTSWGATVGNLTFYAAGAASSHVYGLTTGNVYMGVNNLVIGRCNITGYVYVGNSTTGNVDGMTLKQCLINPASSVCIQNNSGTGNVTNMSIYNNIVISGGAGYAVSLDGRVSGLFKANYLSSYYSTISALSNFYVVNNIVFNNNGFPNSFNNCTIEFNSGNVAAHFQTPGGANNIIGTGNLVKSLTELAFVGGTSPDGYYQLQNSSELKGAGKDGTDIGPFDGDKYKLSGIAPVPNIYGLVIAPITPGASTINVTVTAKGNN